MTEQERIEVGELRSAAGGDEPGTPVELPVVDVLTGRGFVTGKSGSGKSNTASVVIEELLDAGYPVLIVDTDGEYYGLKEEYELLHAGADEECDIQISPEHAERLATLALEENVPVILDVSGYLDESVADDLLCETARHLFAKEKKLKKPFLLVVEEVHEYLPQKGGGGEVGQMLIKVGKRGRKHGLGIMGISQRPADVKKDFITQANWLVWHRLTWDNDTKVVGRVVDDEYEDAVADLDDGEAFLQTDWTEVDVRRIQFRRKRTFDAGATPGLDDFERPELKSVSESLMDDLESITEEEEQRESRMADLQQELDKKKARINQLEQDLEQARDVSNAARQLANAFKRGDVATTPEEVKARLAAKDDRIEELEGEIERLEDELEAEREYVAELEAENQRLRESTATLDVADGEGGAVVQTTFPDGDEFPHDAGDDAADSGPADDVAAVVDAAIGREDERTGTGREPSGDRRPPAGAVDEADVSDVDESDVASETRSNDDTTSDTNHDDASDSDHDEADAAGDRDDRDGAAVESLRDALDREPIASEVRAAVRTAHLEPDDGRAIVAAIAREGPLTAAAVADRTGHRVQYVWAFLSELRSEPYLIRDAEGAYGLNEAALRDRLDARAERTDPSELLERFD